MIFVGAINWLKLPNYGGVYHGQAGAAPPWNDLEPVRTPKPRINYSSKSLYSGGTTTSSIAASHATASLKITTMAFDQQLPYIIIPSRPLTAALEKALQNPVDSNASTRVVN